MTPLCVTKRKKNEKKVPCWSFCKFMMKNMSDEAEFKKLTIL